MEHQNIPNFSWEPIYHEIAHRLVAYYDDRAGLVQLTHQIFEKTGLRMPKLTNSGTLTTIDPFTFFGLFNKHPMRADNRSALLSAIKDILNLEAPIPTSFDGIPVLMALNASFYPLSGNHLNQDIDNLWRFFMSAVLYSDNPNPENQSDLVRFFDNCINIKGNDNGKITMALYWLAPETFLNLDSRNVWYIYESGKFPFDFVSTLPPVQSKIPASIYFEILTKVRDYLAVSSSTPNNFKELSQTAYDYSEQINHEKKQVLTTDNPSAPHYWIYSPGQNARFWDEFYNKGIMAIGWDNIGDLSRYSSKDEINQAMREHLDPSKDYKHSANATWQFTNIMKPGDIIFVKKGISEIVGRGIVKSDYYRDNARPEYKNARKVSWTHRGTWRYPGQPPMKTLTDITDKVDEVKKLNDLFLDEDEGLEGSATSEHPLYTKEDFLADVYLDESEYDTLVDRLLTKKNIILQGAPGVGKTYAATRLAYSIMGEKDTSRVSLVQFHQSYSYEDFIKGFRPTSEGGFSLEDGVFYEFCKEAEIDSDHAYFFIIDEINRGNLSKIFGETFMLMEGDKRGQKIQLLYAEEKFSIPENLYIIGMMNTADRSLALVDYALRRRFAFFDIEPAFNNPVFQTYQKSLANPTFDRLILATQSINEQIASDLSLGKGFRIGHSYFCGLESSTYLTTKLHAIVEYELIPLIDEYWFDDPEKSANAAKTLRGALQ